MSKILPEGWKRTSLGDVVEIFNGKASGTGGTWLRVFKTRHVYNGPVSLSEPAFVPDDRATNVPLSTYIKTGDTLTPNMAHGTIGRVAYVRQAEPNWTVDGQITVLRPRDPTQLLPRYLFDWMSTTDARQALLDREKGGVFGKLRGQTHLYKQDVATIGITIPTVVEQAKIATILSSVDETIENTHAVIDGLRSVKKAMMQEFLLRGIHRPRRAYKHTPVGEVPVDWNIARLGDVADFVNGRAFRPSDWATSGLPIVRIQNLNDPEGKFNYFDGDVESRYLIEPGDLLFSWSGTRGSSFGAHIWQGSRGILNQHIFAVRNLRGVVKEYLYYVLGLVTSQIELHAHGGTGIVHVRKGTLEDFLIPQPPKDEQAEIANCLTAVDDYLVSCEEEIRRLKETKDALMSSLLSGEIRVTPDPEPTP